MLRVTIDLLPGGSAYGQRTVATLEIWNEGTGVGVGSRYKARLVDGRGNVKGTSELPALKRTLPPWELVRVAIESFDVKAPRPEGMALQMPGLSRRQSQVLAGLCAMRDRLDYMPSTREMSREFGVAHTTLREHFINLRDAGYIRLGDDCRPVEILIEPKTTGTAIAPDGSGTVYIAECAEGITKVGYTGGRAGARVANIGYDTHERYKVVHEIASPYAADLERHIHRALESFRVRGREWYRLPAAVVAALASVDSLAEVPPLRYDGPAPDEFAKFIGRLGEAIQAAENAA